MSFQWLCRQGTTNSVAQTHRLAPLPGPGGEPCMLSVGRGFFWGSREAGSCPSSFQRRLQGMAGPHSGLPPSLRTPGLQGAHPGDPGPRPI